MKKLVTTKQLIKYCYLGLKNVHPKDFQNIGEIEQAGTIIEALEEELADYLPLEEKIRDLQDKASVGENIGEELKELNRLSLEAYKKDVKKVIEMEFENEEFRMLFELFNRMGKMWFGKISDFLEFKKQLNEANSRPDKPVKK